MKLQQYEMDVILYNWKHNRYLVLLLLWKDFSDLSSIISVLSVTLFDGMIRKSTIAAHDSENWKES